MRLDVPEQVRTPREGPGAAPKAPFLILALVAVLGAASGCAPGGEARDSVGSHDGVRAPQGVTAGLRLPWKEVSEKISDWSFASDEEEIALETSAPQGRHSVTVWCVVVDRNLYVATDGSKVVKRWVQQLDRDPNARVGIRQRTYPVRVRRVLVPEQWDAVLAAYARKYGARFHQYDFPKVGDTSRGRIYELESRS